MKKTPFVLLFIIISITLSGCYTDTTKKHMKLLEIKVYDKDNNEIEGKYQNFRLFDQDVMVYLNYTMIPLNGNYVVTLYIEKIEESIQYFHTIKWNDGNKTTYFSTSGSNT